MNKEKDKKQETKITCLFEDGNVHEHNQKSYEKMMEHQNNQQTKTKK